MPHLLAHLRGEGFSSDADLALLALHSLQPPIDEFSLRDAAKEHISPPGPHSAQRRKMRDREGERRVRISARCGGRSERRAPPGSGGFWRWSPARTGTAPRSGGFRRWSPAGAGTAFQRAAEWRRRGGYGCCL
jgi:hypothetical protein